MILKCNFCSRLLVLFFMNGADAIQRTTCMSLHDATLAYAYACPTSPCTYMVANTQLFCKAKHQQASITPNYNASFVVLDLPQLQLLHPCILKAQHMCTFAHHHHKATHNQHRTNWTMQALHHPHYTLTQHYTTHYTLCFFFVAFQLTSVSSC